MKLHPALLLGLLLAATPLAAQTDRLEFNGVIIANGVTEVALLDLTTGSTSWIGIGHTFAGYTVLAFHPGKVDASSGFSTPDTLELVGIGTNRHFTLQLETADLGVDSGASTPNEPIAEPWLDPFTGE